MFSRRALEILATNTICISNPSVALERLFSGAIIFVEPQRNTLTDFVQDSTHGLQPGLLDRVSGLNEVLERFTYRRLVEQVFEAVYSDAKKLERKTQCACRDLDSMNLDLDFQTERLIYNIFDNWPQVSCIKVHDSTEETGQLRLIKRSIGEDLEEVSIHIGSKLSMGWPAYLICRGA
jgi:hypothetical protein